MKKIEYLNYDVQVLASRLRDLRLNSKYPDLEIDRLEATEAEMPLLAFLEFAKAEIKFLS